jgi:predicted ATP-grasp superfamily ATP-dependent carboligase
VPAGIADVLGAACTEAGIPSIGLWARVPHYTANSLFPASAVALLEALTTLTGIEVDLSELRHNAEESLRQVDDTVAKNEETAALARELEKQFDAGVGTPVPPEGAVPSADEIADELERYLRGELS